MIKIFDSICSGMIKLAMFISLIIMIALISYALSYVSDFNTREIFFKLTTLFSILFFLYRLGKK